MANRINGVLNAANDPLVLFTGGQSKVGIGISGTWAGTINFQFSVDGLNFYPFGMRAFPPATPTTLVGSTTANGNWEFEVQNIIAVKVIPTVLTSGSPIVQMAASVDASYQEAFLASTSRFVNQAVAAGAANTVTVGAQANRAWRCRKCVIGWSVAPAAAVKLTFSDGPSSTIWETYVPPQPQGVATVGGTYDVPLPTPDQLSFGGSAGGLVNTPGNSFVVTLAAPGGSVASEVNLDMVPA